MPNLIPKKQAGGKSAFMKVDNSLSDNKSMVAKKLVPMISSQANWTGEYINSPMYKERLTKQANTEKMLLNETDSPYTQNGKYLNGDTIFAGNEAKWQGSTIANNVISRNKEQLQHLGNSNIKVGNFSSGVGVGGEYDRQDNKIYLPEGHASSPDGSLIPAHELSHGINRSYEPYSPKFRERYVEGKVLAAGGNDYVQRPTEVKARLDAMRYKMKQGGYYDAGTEKFDATHLQKMKQDPTITNDINYKSLSQELNPKNADNSLMWLFNNIAKNKQTNQVNLAKRGGLIKKK